MKNLTFNFYFIEVPDEQYFPPFPKSAVNYLLFACTDLILQVGFANIRPDFEKLKMKAENYLKGKKKKSLLRWESLFVVYLFFFLLIVEEE